jgi:hypothetical protein
LLELVGITKRYPVLISLIRSGILDGCWAPKGSLHWEKRPRKVVNRYVSPLSIGYDMPRSRFAFIRLWAQSGVVETFALVRPAKTNNHCGVYIYLDEVRYFPPHSFLPLANEGHSNAKRRQVCRCKSWSCSLCKQRGRKNLRSKHDASSSRDQFLDMRLTGSVALLHSSSASLLLPIHSSSTSSLTHSSVLQS